VRAPDLALDTGVNFIDAAEMYPIPPNAATAGRTEEEESLGYGR